jgi:hypothetical protein
LGGVAVVAVAVWWTVVVPDLAVVVAGFGAVVWAVAAVTRAARKATEESFAVIVIPVYSLTFVLCAVFPPVVALIARR